MNNRFLWKVTLATNTRVVAENGASTFDGTPEDFLAMFVQVDEPAPGSGNVTAVASASQTGLLLNTDWTAFNNKGALNSITANGTVAGLTLTSDGRNVALGGNLTIVNATQAGILSSSDFTNLSQKGTSNLTSVTAHGNVSGLTLTGNGTDIVLGGNLIVSNGTTDGLLNHSDFLNFSRKGTSNLTNVTANGTVGGLCISSNGTHITLAGALAASSVNLTGVITGNATGATVLTPNGLNSSQVHSALTDKTGNGTVVFANSPSLVAPNIGTPVFGNLTNCILPKNPLMIVSERYAAGVNGPAGVVGYNTRHLNNVDFNSIPGATLSGYLITGLPAGTYQWRAYGVSHSNGLTRIQLFNRVGTVTLGLGSCQYSDVYASVTSSGEGVFTLSGSCEIELRHYRSAPAGSVFGVAVNYVNPEVYAFLLLEKIS